MDEIAEEVGVSKATLYTYFKSKEDLLKVLSISTNQVLSEIFNKSGKQDSLEPLEELYNKMEESHRFLHLNFEVLSLSSIDEDIRKTNRNVYEGKMETMQAFLQDKQKNGIIRDDIDANILARLITALYTDIAMQLVMGYDKSKIHETWTKALSAILRK